ncbi:hypothetical protein NW752_002309 [Fusarium irregulare]|uniref:Uncharacterized protein n=1 Tax=Fusarium irregulare TaxID=2494466 RepID=A0A9W8PFR9_9HYPO|nr:hypothetical protein NW766_011026 [Fusarium irregulare]KAJ4024856.1 hypothetical protein NW752_002309 [Fusarium irregulare]
MTDTTPNKTFESGGDIGHGSRPKVTKFAAKPQFHNNDSVYVLKPDGNLEGPYLVATAQNADRKCTLCYTDGTPFRNNQEISVDELQKAN